MAVAMAAEVEEAAAAAAEESHGTVTRGASLPVRRLAHTGPARRLGVAAGRINGGHDTAKGEFPYMVSLKIVGTFTKSHHCGGAIISSTSVLTAAHCITNIDKSIGSTVLAGSLSAVAGELDQSTDKGTEQEVRISQMIKQPDHPGGTDVSPNDIAIFKLMTAFTFNSFVQPINLPSAGVVPTAAYVGDGVKFYIGTLEDYQKVFEFRKNQQLPFHTFKDITGRDVKGDSGSPVTQDGMVVGMASWTIMPCATERSPSVYTRVSAFLDFVNEHI
ncbi:trypsin-1-like [Schistocerca americana]|uniref:trypsin-1-like n=1 Tax=Schistocerca americana TaxID=7009 RepID=UPI001F4F8A21|nr:trypsin-1-like [Schistocerca americana]